MTFSHIAVLPRTLLLGLSTAVMLTAAIGAARAQSGPSISTMPPPPSTTNAGPKERVAPKSKPRKATRQPRPTDEITFTDPAEKPARARRGTGSSQQTFDRPQRYVPEEFDRDGRSGGVEPFVTQGGRPGMGMRF